MSALHIINRSKKGQKRPQNRSKSIEKRQKTTKNTSKTVENGAPARQGEEDLARVLPLFPRAMSRNGTSVTPCHTQKNGFANAVLCNPRRMNQSGTRRGNGLWRARGALGCRRELRNARCQTDDRLRRRKAQRQPERTSSAKVPGSGVTVYSMWKWNGSRNPCGAGRPGGSSPC